MATCISHRMWLHTHTNKTQKQLQQQQLGDLYVVPNLWQNRKRIIICYQIVINRFTEDCDGGQAAAVVAPCSAA